MESEQNSARTCQRPGMFILHQHRVKQSLRGFQGFQVSDEEISMDLATFKEQYANSGGSVEYDHRNPLL